MRTVSRCCSLVSLPGIIIGLTNLTTMRLLHTSKFTLVDVPSHDPPEHAILSHTQGRPKNNVLPKDTDSGLKAAQEKASFVKVENTYKKARSDRYEYCCIDTYLSSVSTGFLLISVKLGPIFITFLRVILRSDWSAQIAHSRSSFC
jgi:hypothetical protein